MSTDGPVGPLAPLTTGLPFAPTLAATLVRRLGGRYSTEMGIDVDAGDAQVERWFVASTLFGARIGAKVARRTFAVLEDSGIHRITDVEGRERAELVGLLDSGGYARYDFRTATRLQSLARQVADRYGGSVAEIGRRFVEPDDLAAALDDLTGWGPVTVGLFLRELRGVWPGAHPELDRRATVAGRHLGILCEDGDRLAHLHRVARLSACEPRDLEGALVRLALVHPRAGSCPGGRGCVVLAQADELGPGRVRKVSLPGRRIVTIRPPRPDDVPGLAALFDDLGEDDVYRRFFSARPPLEPFVTKLAAVADRGGGGLVATICDHSDDAGIVAPDGGHARTERIVAEATYTPLTNGDAELGITVARHARGWLGPYLLDTLLEDAAARGFPNLRSDVLVTNAQMLAMLRRRGYAVIGFDDHPAIVRLSVGTVGRIPSWAGAHVARRVLVETPGGRWHADDAIRRAGFEVMGCPAPPGGWVACPERRGEPCPLATAADVIVVAVPGEAGRSLVDAHRRTHPTVPICAEIEPDEPDPGPVAARIPRGSPGTVAEAVIERILLPGAEAALTSQVPHPGTTGP
jgi:hypothetical protein